MKSGRSDEFLSGIATFTEAYRSVRTLPVGGDGLPIDRFLSSPVERLLKL